MNNQTDEPIDLAEDGTLKGYGRKQHGLNGKDADLSAGGQNKIKTAFWFEDHIEISGHRYASIVPSENWTEEQKDSAQEMVCGCGYPGEWDGDYWIVGEDYRLNVPCEWKDYLSDKKNIDRALRFAYKAIMKDSRPFEREMAGLSAAFNEMEVSELEG
jgi:hypothetical protein